MSLHPRNALPHDFTSGLAARRRGGFRFETKLSSAREGPPAAGGAPTESRGQPPTPASGRTQRVCLPGLRGLSPLLAEEASGAGLQGDSRAPYVERVPGVFWASEPGAVQETRRSRLS